MVVRIQSEGFDPGEELNTFTKLVDGAGAIVSFTGVVRDVADGLSAMKIEHYPGMTEAAIAKIIEEASNRWALNDVLVIHRYGMLQVSDNIMMVATASRHRSDAFTAAEFLMDYLKSRAPFWKKEATRKGDAWVSAKDDDESALKRW